MNSALDLPFRRGVCLILSSPSGAGKTTLARLLMEAEPQLKHSVSVTTRQPRPQEQHGRDYFFVSPEKFQAMLDADELLESAEVFGNLYGTPAGPVKQAVAAGDDMIFDVDWQGARSISSILPEDTVRVFILPPSSTELARRIYTRASDSNEVIESRLEEAAIEISHWQEYDYVIVNRHLEESLAALRSILEAERHKRHRQQGLTDFVVGLTSAAAGKRPPIVPPVRGQS